MSIASRCAFMKVMHVEKGPCLQGSDFLQHLTQRGRIIIKMSHKRRVAEFKKDCLCNEIKVNVTGCKCIICPRIMGIHRMARPIIHDNGIGGGFTRDSGKGNRAWSEPVNYFFY